MGAEGIFFVLITYFKENNIYYSLLYYKYDGFNFN